ncbi:14264_t:CDS:2 [Acaulospora morrowiae]|uniref:18S rRNA factor 2 n=1 Tax=Acaulospora morrowiae TaxID=94023 RepID=A0A9N8VM05_9GLOM|nr:14264_t:CDS:2 [Acaulospora morrowiae]
MDDKIVKPLSREELLEFEKAQNKTGLVYLSRIPPFMKPPKIKHLLSQYGEVGRVYLVPEDPKIKERRAKYSGNRKKNYTEGWVEFMDKKVAKLVAVTLNTQPIGGNRRNNYHDDLWNIKYLPKFKWNHLTEQIAYENAARVRRLQAEISQGRRENKEYIKKVEKAKMIQNIEQKKEKKRKAIESERDNASETLPVDVDETKKKPKISEDNDTVTSTNIKSTSNNNQKRRHIKQRKLITKEFDVTTGDARNSLKTDDEVKRTSSGIKGVLNKVFGK